MKRNGSGRVAHINRDRKAGREGEKEKEESDEDEDEERRRGGEETERLNRTSTTGSER